MDWTSSQQFPRPAQPPQLQFHSMASSDGSALHSAASSANGADGAPALVGGVAAAKPASAPEMQSGDEGLLSSIGRLKAEQAALRAEKKKVTTELRNAEKRRARLKKKARQLSDHDLTVVLQMRSDTATTAASKESVQKKKVAVEEAAS